MAHSIITLFPWVPPFVPHVIPPRYITKCLGGGDVPRTTFYDEFFFLVGPADHRRRQLLYAGMDFRGDSNLVLPPNVAWRDTGNKFFKF